MNTRLEQDAADALAAYEQQQRWRDRANADWQRAQPAPMGEPWRPTLTEQQKQEQKEYIRVHNLPF